MITWLIKNEIKSAFRSVIRHQNIAGGIIFGIVILILMLNILSLGLFIDQVFKLAAPDKDPIKLFNGILIYFFWFDLILRFLMQSIPDQITKPYLQWPIKRSTLVHYVLLKSNLSFFNFIPLLIFVPFAIKIIAPNQTSDLAINWLAAVILIMLGNCYINFFIQKQLILKPGITFGFVGLLLAFIGLDYFDFISLTTLSEAIFTYLMKNSISLAILLFLLIGLYVLNYRTLKSQLYLENMLVSKRKSSKSVQRFAIFNFLGETGQYMSLELKLLFRNKRPRATIYFIGAVILFGFFFYPMMTRLERDFYPIPSETIVDDLKIYPATQKAVTFEVHSAQIPENAHVHIAGNHPKLGDWKAYHTPLRQNIDGTWRRTFVFNTDTELKYRFSLGTWGTEALIGTEKEPTELFVKVTTDTTIAIDVPSWTVPTRPAILDFNLLYWGILLTGLFILSYGQFILCWEGNYFQTLISKNIDFKKYFMAKLILMLIGGFICFLLTVPFVYYGIYILEFNIASFFYNIGINTYFYLFMSVFSRKKLDLNAGIFSTQGKGGRQFLVFLPTIIVPILIYLLIRSYLDFNSGIIAMAGVGITGLALYRPLMQMVVRLFYQQKYKIAAGFRQS